MFQKNLTFLAIRKNKIQTKIPLHCHHALQLNRESKVVVRSPSGDVDILVILFGVIDIQYCVYLYSGTGNGRKCILLGDIDLTTYLKNHP